MEAGKRRLAVDTARTARTDEVHRVLEVHDLITSPAYIVVKAASEFKDKVTEINQLRQTGLPTSRFLAGVNSISARS